MNPMQKVKQTMEGRQANQMAVKRRSSWKWTKLPSLPNSCFMELDKFIRMEGAKLPLCSGVDGSFPCKWGFIAQIDNGRSLREAHLTVVNLTMPRFMLRKHGNDRSTFVRLVSGPRKISPSSDQPFSEAKGIIVEKQLVKAIHERPSEPVELPDAAAIETP